MKTSSGTQPWNGSAAQCTGELYQMQSSQLQKMSTMPSENTNCNSNNSSASSNLSAPETSGCNDVRSSQYPTWADYFRPSSSVIIKNNDGEDVLVRPENDLCPDCNKVFCFCGVPVSDAEVKKQEGNVEEEEMEEEEEDVEEDDVEEEMEVGELEVNVTGSEADDEADDEEDKPGR